jgi:hypothetical protein
LMQCSEKEWSAGTFYCCEHFSLANPLHLAIMSGQLGIERDARSQREFGNDTSCFALGCNSS